MMELLSSAQVEQFLEAKLADREIAGLIQQFALPYRELMAYYRCAMMEVSEKFHVLNEEMSLQYDRNPIETVKTRLKSPESIVEKLQRRGYPLSVESIEANLNDVAGVRVICSYTSDIYMLADALTRQDDILLIKRKDYIENPKPNGYRSLHLIVGVPIFLRSEKKIMKVEVQFRTISMDFWASLEHKIRYKKNLPTVADLERELFECAVMSAELENRMERIQRMADCYMDDSRKEEETMTSPSRNIIKWGGILAGSAAVASISAFVTTKYLMKMAVDREEPKLMKLAEKRAAGFMEDDAFYQRTDRGRGRIFQREIT